MANAKRIEDHRWEGYRETVSDLYGAGSTQAEIRNVLQAQGFDPSPAQLAHQIQKWRFVRHRPYYSRYRSQLMGRHDTRLVLRTVIDLLLSEDEFYKALNKYWKVCQRPPDHELFCDIFVQFFAKIWLTGQIEDIVSIITKSLIRASVSIIIKSFVRASGYKSIMYNARMERDLNERLAMIIAKPLASSDGTSSHDNTLPSGSMDDVRSLLVDSPAYTSFLFRLRYELATQSLECITSRLSTRRSSSALPQASTEDELSIELILRCDIKSFVSVHLDSGGTMLNLDDSTVIVGRNKDFLATSNGAYLLSLGVARPHELFSILERMVGPSTNTIMDSVAVWTSSGGRLKCSLMVYGTRHEDSILLKLHGQVEAVRTIMKAWAFLAAALRPHNSQEIVWSVVEPTYVSVNEYTISCVPLKRPRHLDMLDAANCWRSLFNKAIVVLTSPISEDRQDFHGLEISCSLMLALAEPFYPNLDEVGIWLENCSFFLFPVRGQRSDAKEKSSSPSDQQEGEIVFDKVQWHLERVQEGLTPYQQLGQFSAQRLRCNKLSDLLNAKKTYLGYCNESNLNLGDIGTTVLKGTTCSQAQEEILVGFYQFPPNLSAGIGYKGYVNGLMTSPYAHNEGITTGFEDKDLKYIDILNLSRKYSVILYDDHPVSGGRGWLVPMINVILHLIYLWAVKEAQDISRLASVALPHSPGFSTDADFAYEYFYHNGSILLEHGVPGCGDDDQCIHHFVRRYWRKLKSMAMAQLVSMTEYRHKSSLLYGWDLLDIALMELQTRRRETVFTGNWLSLANKPNMLVLFGHNLGEIIQTSESLCSRWQSSQLTSKQFLIAYNKCLIDLARRDDSIPEPDVSSCMRLGNEIYWPIEVGQICATCTECIDGAECTKTLQKLQSFRSSDPTIFRLNARGAVVFGQVPNRLQKMRPNETPGLPLGRVRPPSADLAV